MQSVDSSETAAEESEASDDSQRTDDSDESDDSQTNESDSTYSVDSIVQPTRINEYYVRITHKISLMHIEIKTLLYSLIAINLAALVIQR